MNETFVAGTREYESVLKSRLEASETNTKDEISPYLRDIMRSVGNLTAAQNKLSNQINDVKNRLDNEIPSEISAIVRKEIKSFQIEHPPQSPQIKPQPNYKQDIQVTYYARHFLVNKYLWQIETRTQKGSGEDDFF